MEQIVGPSISWWKLSWNKLLPNLALTCVQHRGSLIWVCNCLHSHLQKTFAFFSLTFSKMCRAANQSLNYKTSLFSYHVPEDGGTQWHISGYLHASGKTSGTWLFDYWIIPGNTCWTPVEPGQHGDERQQNSILAICEDGLRWLPTIRALDARHAPWRRPEKEWTGGQLKNMLVPARESGAGAAAGGSSWQRCRSRQRHNRFIVFLYHSSFLKP